ncbi:MAG: hypothetical protein K940chlam2_01501 [Chlamydiae bacterium]|nr:hypothetical protein [Chlamydiota bacterium]
MIQSPREISPLAPSQPLDLPQLRFQESSNDTLSSMGKSGGCFSSLWTAITHLFEAISNAFLYLLWCGGKSPFPKPFEQTGDSAISEAIYSQVYSQFPDPNALMEQSIPIGTELIMVTDQIAATFEETLTIDPEACQCAYVTLTFSSHIFSTLLVPEKQEKMRYTMANSFLYFLSGIEGKPETIHAEVDYFRLSGNRFEWHQKDGAVEEKWAFTKSGARENFISAYNQALGKRAQAEELFDASGKLTLTAPTILGPELVEEMVETLFRLFSPGDDIPQLLILKSSERLVFTRSDKAALRRTIAKLPHTEMEPQANYLAVVGNFVLHITCGGSNTSAVTRQIYTSPNAAREGFTKQLNELAGAAYQETDLFNPEGKFKPPSLNP